MSTKTLKQVKKEMNTRKIAGFIVKEGMVLKYPNGKCYTFKRRKND
jgi:hypothetical protein